MANVKKIIKGAQKAAKMAKRINNAREKRYGNAYAEVSPKGKLVVKENMTSHKIKGKIKNIRDNAQMEELNAKRPIGAAKVKSLTYIPKDWRLSKSGTRKPTTPKVPVKRRGK